MQGAFILAHTYSPPSVLGLRLRPFSPWHGLLLEAAGSPFLCGGRVDADDLILGAWVCSKSYCDGFRTAADAASARKWGAKTKRFHLAAELSAFNSYLDASFTAPEYWKSGDGSSVKAPYFWHLAYFAMLRLHLPEADAWDYPIAKISCYQACAAELSGNSNLMSADEIKGIELLRAAETQTREVG